MKNQNLKAGLTIIEVLTSIVVAMIGVMGVMILVPFAVRQAQTGMDTEMAAVVARNAFNQFEIGGYRNHDNWLVVGASGPQSCARGIYSIDPLAVTSNRMPDGSHDYDNTTFPYNLDPTPSGNYNGYPRNPPPPVENVDYRIPVANLRLPEAAIVPMQKLDARRLFIAADDLVFGESQNTSGQQDAQLNGPGQIFDSVGGNPVRRQAAGRFSWSAIAQPSGSSNWKLFVLVYKDREIDVTARDANPLAPNFSISPHMRAVQIAFPNDDGIQMVSSVRIDPTVRIPSGSIKKDDWVMLINQRKRDNPDPLIPTRPLHWSDWQIGFYRIINFEAETPGGFITLDGPDFNFDLDDYEPTFMVHLKNVVGVYERTIVPEGKSTWNLSF